MSYCGRFRANPPLQRNRQRDLRQREGHHMRVEVGVDEGERGELVDHADQVVRAGRDDARRIPVPPFRAEHQRLALRDDFPQSSQSGNDCRIAGDQALELHAAEFFQPGEDQAAVRPDFPG